MLPSPETEGSQRARVLAAAGAAGEEIHAFHEERLTSRGGGGTDGWEEDRPVFLSLCEAARRGVFETLWVLRPDRQDRDAPRLADMARRLWATGAEIRYGEGEILTERDIKQLLIWHRWMHAPGSRSRPEGGARVRA